MLMVVPAANLPWIALLQNEFLADDGRWDHKADWPNGMFFCGGVFNTCWEHAFLFSITHPEVRYDTKQYNVLLSQQSLCGLIGQYLASP
jgi:hypothetical protein